MGDCEKCAAVSAYNRVWNQLMDMHVDDHGRCRHCDAAWPCVTYDALVGAT